MNVLQHVRVEKSTKAATFQTMPGHTLRRGAAKRICFPCVDGQSRALTKTKMPG